MSLALSRAFGILELLTGEPTGLPLNRISSELEIPKSATHRTLADLVELGYLRQEGALDHYVLSMKVVSIAQRHLAQIPLVDLAKPFLDRLASISGELSRLSIVDGSSLVWVAKTQGSKSALRYDPDAGSEVKLSCTASGLAWLSTVGDEEAVSRVESQGYADSEGYGPLAPRNENDFIRELHTARELGYCYTKDTFEPGIAALAVAIVPTPGEEAAGVINICGPSVRLTAELAKSMVPEVQDAANKLALVFTD